MSSSLIERGLTFNNRSESPLLSINHVPVRTGRDVLEASIFRSSMVRSAEIPV